MDIEFLQLESSSITGATRKLKQQVLVTGGAKKLKQLMSRLQSQEDVTTQVSVTDKRSCNNSSLCYRSQEAVTTQVSITGAKKL